MVMFALPKWDLQSAEAFSEPYETFTMERFAKIVNGWKSLIIFVKRFMLGVWQGSEYASGVNYLKTKNFDHWRTIDF